MATVNTAHKFLTLADVEKEDKGPLYVLNTATAPEGRIILGILRKNGIGADPLRIPRTFIPIDLTHQVPRSQILESADFRRTVAGGLLKILAPEYAQVILNTEDGREEQDRVNNEMSQIASLVENSTLSESADISPAEQRAHEVASAARPSRSLDDLEETKERPKKPAGAALKVRQIIADAAAESWEPKKIILELKRYGEQKLTKEDFKVLSATYNGNPKVFKYLKSVYNVRKNDI